MGERAPAGTHNPTCTRSSSSHHCPAQITFWARYTRRGLNYKILLQPETPRTEQPRGGLRATGTIPKWIRHTELWYPCPKNTTRFPGCAQRIGELARGRSAAALGPWIPQTSSLGVEFV